MSDEAGDCCTEQKKVMTIKRCGSCIHWRDALTGWCDYYSWPMDADDDEPCKAYEPIEYSENYVPVMVNELIELEDTLRREGISDDPKKRLG